VIVFGGFNGKSYLDDLYILDSSAIANGTVQWSLVSTKGQLPSPRYAHSCNFVSRGRLIIFGGCGSSVFQDIHVLDLATMTWYPVNPSGDIPSGRAYHVSI
jgi:hypothetical protein